MASKLPKVRSFSGTVHVAWHEPQGQVVTYKGYEVLNAQKVSLCGVPRRHLFQRARRDDPITCKRCLSLLRKEIDGNA